MKAGENEGPIIDLMVALKASLAQCAPRCTLRCDRVVLLLAAGGKRKKHPVPAGTELKETYDIGGVHYRVVDVLPADEPELHEVQV